MCCTFLKEKKNIRDATSSILQRTHCLQKGESFPRRIEAKKKNYLEPNGRHLVTCWLKRHMHPTCIPIHAKRHVNINLPCIEERKIQCIQYSKLYQKEAICLKRTGFFPFFFFLFLFFGQVSCPVTILLIK